MIDTRQKTIKSRPNFKMVRRIDEDLQFQTCVVYDLAFVEHAFANYLHSNGLVIIFYEQLYEVKTVWKK